MSNPARLESVSPFVNSRVLWIVPSSNQFLKAAGGSTLGCVLNSTRRKRRLSSFSRSNYHRVLRFTRTLNPRNGFCGLVTGEPAYVWILRLAFLLMFPRRSHSAALLEKPHERSPKRVQHPLRHLWAEDVLRPIYAQWRATYTPFSSSKLPTTHTNVDSTTPRFQRGDRKPRRRLRLQGAARRRPTASWLQRDGTASLTTRAASRASSDPPSL